MTSNLTDQIDALFERLEDECEGEDLLVVLTACTILIAETIEKIEGDKDRADCIESVRGALVEIETELYDSNNRNINLH